MLFLKSHWGKPFSLKSFVSHFLSQVNIYTSWTLPQTGFNVFYRYFRDKISWFEADAVCQFHHANLVTGNSLNEFCNVFQNPRKILS